MRREVNPREKRKAQLALKLIIVCLLSVQLNLPILWNQKKLCSKRKVTNSLSYREAYGARLWVSFYLQSSKFIIWDGIKKKQYDPEPEMPLNVAGMGWRMNLPLLLSVQCFLPRAFFWHTYLQLCLHYLYHIWQRASWRYQLGHWYLG